MLDLSQREVDTPDPVEDRRANELFWQYHDDFWSPQTISPVGRVRSWSDLYSRSELRRQPLYAEFFGPEDAKHFLSLGFPAPRVMHEVCCSSGKVAATSPIEKGKYCSY